MATLIDVDKVKYLCSCNRLKPLSSLYYCKYCKPFALKCKECVLHEIDQKYFCASCFDNKTHKEATNSKFKCLNCFSCPCCKNSLMIRASSGTAAQKAQKAALAAATANTTVTSAPAITEESNTAQQQQQQSPPVVSQQQQSQKVFYLMCGFCRWTTRDVGIPDVLTIPGNWKTPENPNLKRISELLDAYKTVAAREKQEKDRKKYITPKRRAFNLGISNSNMSASGNLMSVASSSATSTQSLHSDKYGILGPANRRIKNLSSATQSGQESYINQSIEIQLKSLLKPSITVENFDPLPDDIFSKPINVNSITSINQRHANPEYQPSKSIELSPLNKFYVTKESKRCNGCEHNVLKPESNITSIRFKLHQMAIFMVPEVRIVAIPEWKLNEPNEIILMITNKCEIDLNVKFVSFRLDDKTNGESIPSNLSGFEPNANILFDLINEDQEIQIDHQDSAKSQPASLKQSDLNTNGFVCFRRDNKLGIVCKVVPIKSRFDDLKLNREPHVRAVFGLKHFLDQKAVSESSSTSIQQQTTAASTPNPSKNIVMQKIFIDFGPLRKEDGHIVINKPKYIDESFA